MNFFLHSDGPEGPLRSKKFQITLVLAFEANSVLSHKNDTKIVKITHIEQQVPFYKNHWSAHAEKAAVAAACIVVLQNILNVICIMSWKYNLS